MSPRLVEKATAPVPSAGKELSELTAMVSNWGMEAGFLGIEGHLEGRLLALLREASVRLFGNCEAERDRLLCRIEAMEKEMEESARGVEKCRERHNAIGGRLSLIARLHAWFSHRAEISEARSVCRRNEPDLRKAHLDFEVAERTRRDAAEWREMAAQSLRASYEYHKERAALVRPETSQLEEEQNHDTRDNRQFIVHRAN